MTRKQGKSTPKRGGRQYHLETRPGDIAPNCLLVGSPDRAEMIAESFFRKARKVGDHRGLKSFTGTYNGIPMSVVTTGMGGASTGIVLPEAVASGAERFIRVGSCGALQPGIKVGDSIICTGAVRLDGASDNWAPMEFPAVADWRLVGALVEAAEMLVTRYHVGLGATTSCFNEGQARLDPPSLLRSYGRAGSNTGYVPKRLLERHEEIVRAGVKFYSMEEAAIFVWCATHGQIPCAGVNAVFVNRSTGEKPQVKGEYQAARIALDAFSLIGS